MDENCYKTDILLTLRFLRENNLLLAFKMNMMYLNDEFKGYDADRFKLWVSTSDIVRYLLVRLTKYRILRQPIEAAFGFSWTNEGYHCWDMVRQSCASYLNKMLGCDKYDTL